MNNGRKIQLPMAPGDRELTLIQYVGKYRFFFRNRNLELDLAEGRFLLGENRAESTSRLSGGQPLYFCEPPWQEPEICTDIPTVFENETLLVVDKPAGLPTTPTGPFYENCLLHWLRRTTGNTDLSPCHRLDIETSGLICFAKKPEARGFFQKQFQRGTPEKRYLAMVFGSMSADTEAIELPLGRDTKIFTKFVPHQEGKYAHTKILGFEHWREYSFVELQPVTGRTNQIRAHLAAIGHSIVGDKKYNPNPDLFLDWVSHRNLERWRPHLKLSRQALHCSGLKLRSPSGEHELKSPRSVVTDWKSEIRQNTATRIAEPNNWGPKGSRDVAPGRKPA